MWLKDTDKGLYDKIRTVFTLNDYIVMKLTGKVFAERTNAAESMLYDLKNNCWSDDIITKLGIKRDFSRIYRKRRAGREYRKRYCGRAGS